MSRTDEELCEAVVCAYPDDTGGDRGRRAVYDLGRADALDAVEAVLMDQGYLQNAELERALEALRRKR